MKKAAEMNGGEVVRVLVADVSWAAEQYGGNWLDVSGTEVSAGWREVDGELLPPPPAASWTTWNGAAYEPPVPVPAPVAGFSWVWDEDAGGWTQEPAAEE